MSLASPSPLAALALDIVGPAFVLAKQFGVGYFHSRFMEATRTFINDKLEWVLADDHPDWRPHQADIDYATGVMHMTYADRFVVDGKDAEKRREQQRQQALELITMCLGNWQSYRIVHWRHACCADRAQAVFTVFTLAHGIIVEHAMGTVVVAK
jgi:hypothetical protein